MRVLILSPHYDDAPLSLGQSMLDGELSGHDVTVGIVYGRSNWVRWFHPTRSRAPLASAIRRGEELLNSALFGYRIRVGDRDEAVLRLDSMQTADFLDADFDATYDAELEPTTVLVSEWAESADVVLAPMGLGHHIDHQLVSRAARLLSENGSIVGFYEDRPYACTMGDEEIEAHVASLPGDLGPQAMSGPISADKHRRLFYPSQFDDFFNTAMRLDEEFARVESAWFLPGEGLERA